jgi:serine/threonine protein kinase
MKDKAEVAVNSARSDEDSAETLSRIISGRYELKEKLGRGGMGVVYRAYDRQLGMDVAIKVLIDRFANDLSAAETLKQEAKAAMRLAHPNIIRLYNFETTPEATYLLMEFVKGESLAAMASKKTGGRFSEQEVIKYISEVCEALKFAHAEHVIHRDIKPSNIIVMPDGRVKLADFGIALVKQNPGDNGEGRFGGTPTYMSPEQVFGRPLDGRSDIYSLGVTMYQMLAGFPPFRGEEVSLQHIHAIPKHIDGVSSWMNSIVMKCLRKEPDGRWRSAAELKDVLTGKMETDVPMQSKYQPWWVARSEIEASPPATEAASEEQAPKKVAPPEQEHLSVYKTPRLPSSSVHRRVEKIGRYAGLVANAPEYEQARMGFGTLAGIGAGLIISFSGGESPQVSYDSPLFQWSWVLYGGLIGIAIGVAQKRTGKGMLSLSLGVLGGMLAGLLMGLFRARTTSEMPVLGILEPSQYGVLGGAVVGAFLGAADGIYERSARYFVRCLLWGGVGGALGGAVLCAVKYLFSAFWSPVLNWIVVGAALGFFINMGVAFAERPETRQRAL